MTVVGVCGDIIQDWFDRRNAPTMYRPFAQAPADYFAIAVRTAGDPAAVAGAVRQALLRVDPTQPVFEMMTMRRQLKERTIGLQYLAAIMTVFAALALLLAAVGSLRRDRLSGGAADGTRSACASRSAPPPPTSCG